MGIAGVASSDDDKSLGKMLAFHQQFWMVVVLTSFHAA